ncbi:MAG: SDR family NAD(P)-dependent oxidoreductase [Parvibaculaceae bacterium]
MAEDPHRPDFSLAGRTVLVTGASRGIGRAIAQGCWRAGADLVLGVRDPANVADIVRDAWAAGRRALAVRMDIGDLAQIRAGVAEGHKAMGRIDVLVNNVGIGPEAPAEEVKEADFDQTVNVNLKGTFFMSQTVGRLMIAQGGGRIVNVSSQAGTVALRTESIYCMTKAAINHLTRCLAFEWAVHKINVNSVAPTFIWTDGTRPYLSEPRNETQVLGHIPLGRIGEPIDVVGAVIFLASPASSLITGANLLIDGGWSLG